MICCGCRCQCLGYTEFAESTTDFVQHHIGPVPSWEQDRPVGTITTPGGTWVPTLAAKGIIPWLVWQTMYFADLEVGRDVVLVVLLHSLCNMNSV